MSLHPSNLPPKKNRPAPTKKADCPYCIRARWIMTFLMLGTMATILYLNEFAA